MIYFRKLLNILNFNEKKKLLICYFFILIASILEFLSISSIIPLINLIVDTNYQTKILEYFNSSFLTDFFSDDFAVKVILLIISVFLLKFLFLTYLSWYRASYNEKLIVRIKNEIFSLYLNQKYIFFIKNHSSKLIRNLSNEANLFIGTINNFISILLETSVLISLLILVYIFQPIESFVIIIIIILLGLIIYFPLKKILNKWGIIRQKNDAYNIKNIQQGIGAIKDIKINQKENFFLKQFNFTSSLSARAGKIRGFLFDFPRLWLELVIILSVFVSLVYLLKSQSDFIDIISTLAIYAAVGFRALPSVNRLIVAYQGLAYTKTVVNVIEEQFELKKNLNFNRSLKPIKFEKNIIIKDISFEYENFNVFDKLNLNIKKNQCVGIIGESGSGKTTLINLISGLLEPKSGGIYIDEIELKDSKEEWLRLIGYMSQNTYIFDDTLEKNITMDDEKVDINKLNEVLNVACIKEIFDRSKLDNAYNLGEYGSKLSLGQIQRIGIARALYQNPSILILDEATSALDLETEEKLIDNLIKYCNLYNITTILVSHRKKPLVNCDLVFSIETGKIISNDE